MSEDIKKPEQNGPPIKPNQNHRVNENIRGGHEGGRGRFTRFGPRRDRDHNTRPQNDQVS